MFGEGGLVFVSVFDFDQQAAVWVLRAKDGRFVYSVNAFIHTSGSLLWLHSLGCCRLREGKEFCLFWTGIQSVLLTRFGLIR